MSGIHLGAPRIRLRTKTSDKSDMQPFANYFWEHPLLKENVRELQMGEFLFHQHEAGRSMFIVLSGIVELLAEASGGGQVVSLIEPGQFLGEQAIVRDKAFTRVFGAKARGPVRVLELNRKVIDKIQVQSPPLLIDILKGIFSVASDRLYRANQIITFLRLNNNEWRLLSLLLHFAKTTGVTGPQGVEVILESTTIRYYLEMSLTEIHQTLSKWEDAILISRGALGAITIFDELSLSEQLEVPKPKETLQII